MIMKDKIQNWLFGKYLLLWVARRVRKYATQVVISDAEILHTNPQRREEMLKHYMRRMAHDLADAMLADGTITFEKSKDYPFGGEVLRMEARLLKPKTAFY